MSERVYPSFSITPSGFEPAIQRQSCLPCRRKKKRCDGCRPCGLCRNSNGRDKCTWPAERRTRRTRRPSNNPNVSLQSRERSKAGVPDNETLSRRPREIPKTGSPDNEPLSQRLGPTTNSVTLLESLLKSLPDIPPDIILRAAGTFEREVFGSHPLYQKSTLETALPLAVKHKPFMHAWIAAILIKMPDDDDKPRWRSESMVHYTHAIHGLNISIMADGPDVDYEWKRANSLLLHAIEMQQADPCSHVARVHVSMAHTMWGQIMGRPDLPASEHDMLLFEAYFMRTAANTLLQQDIHKKLPFNYVQDLETMHQRALERLSLTMTPQNCPWLSGPGPELINLMYKASWLTVQSSLTKELNDEAVNLWHWSSTIVDAGTQRVAEIEPNLSASARCVLQYACRSLLRLLVLDVDVGNTALELETITATGMRHLDNLTQISCQQVGLMWPLLVMGTLSTSRGQQQLCLTIAARFRAKAAAIVNGNILLFWTQAWAVEDVAARFNDCELLRSILL